MILLFFYLFLALFVSFLCSIMEAVLLTTPLSYLIVKKKQGSRIAGIMIKLKQKIDRPLSAILSLNTIAHTVGAAGVGAQAIYVFGDAYFGLISAILTILILIFSEIIPKTIGASYWRNLNNFVGHAVQVTIIITYPLVIISSLFSKLFSKKQADLTTSREEMAALANIGEKEGIFGEKENKIIQNIIRLKNTRVSEIMTPRVVLVLADENMAIQDFPGNRQSLHFSRIPVYAENYENITGYIMVQDIFEKLAENKDSLKLKDIRRDILIYPENLTVYDLWERLLERKEHIAVIVDEYGGMEGIVTMEDIIETLLGFEIMDEKDTITDMQEYARNRWNRKLEKIRHINQHKAEDREES
ncbi:MAG: DUF21 domain-containing protein [Bacteroidales bacterium]|nr:DUF21 domain-containing protein [Bacteroidales bacterium]MBN2698400.1 DUF21 domain-containing protein [Bacteroidales bacterium]